MILRCLICKTPYENNEILVIPTYRELAYRYATCSDECRHACNLYNGSYEARRLKAYIQHWHEQRDLLIKLLCENGINVINENIENDNDK